MRHVVIVGGGVSGLALAYRLQQRRPDADALVLEAAPAVGGKVATAARAGFRVESGPNGFLDTKPTTLELCREVGLAPQLVQASEAAARNRYLLLGGRLRRLPSGLLSFVTSRALSWRAKYRVLTERFRRPRPPGLSSLPAGPAGSGEADESVDSFARRRVGDEIADTLLDAFVTGIYAGDPKLLSAAAAFPRLTAYEREHGSLLRGMAAAARARRAEAAARGEPYQRAGKMWSLADGLGRLVSTLRDRLRTPPVVGVAARRVERLGAGWRVRGEGADRWDADAVVLACPAYEQAAILGDLDAELAERVGGVAYNRVAVVALGYRAGDIAMSLDGFGYLSPQRERRDVLGVQWCSSIFPGRRAPEGMVLLRAMCGGWHRGEVVDWDDDRLLRAVRDELAAALGLRAVPAFHEIVRWRRAIPQYHLGHLERVAWVEARAAQRHPGLYLAGNAYRGVALNDCVEQAGVLAERIAGDLSIPPLPGTPVGGGGGVG
jgi:oxygen-dependent protoporphyrinogen oxidase